MRLWGLFQLEKSLSPIDRKWLYIINLNFFVWRHKCHRFLLKFWLFFKQLFSCLTPNWNSPLAKNATLLKSAFALIIMMSQCHMPVLGLHPEIFNIYSQLFNHCSRKSSWTHVDCRYHGIPLLCYTDGSPLCPILPKPPPPRSNVD